MDTSRATLNDLVEDVLKLELGYGDEFSINNEVGTLYDPELIDNLSKKLSELGIKGDSFLTIIDDDEEDPRVNLSLTISEKSAFPLDLLAWLLADLTRRVPGTFPKTLKQSSYRRNSRLTENLTK